MLYGCIDMVGSGRPADAVYFDSDQRRLWHEQYSANDDVDFVKRVVAGVLARNPDVLAIDAPCKHNVGRLEIADVRKAHGLDVKSKVYVEYRVAEMLLRRLNIGLYNTPRDTTTLQPWMIRGFALYRELVDQGYQLWDTPGQSIGRPAARTLIEVHPHACFVTSFGWVPQPKDTLAGQLERCAWLAVQMRELDVQDDPDHLIPSDDDRRELARRIAEASWDSIATTGLDLPAFSHDRLDALAGLLTAICFGEGHATAVGDQEDGVLILPQPLSGEAYRQLRKR
jgi:predicted nuclease with RNAse H fold